MSVVFTRKHTMREIMDQEEIRKYLGILFPPALCGFVPDSYWDEPVERIEKEVRMPWGALFEEFHFVDMANQVMKMIQEKPYEFIPLWTEQPIEGYMPEVEKNSRETVCLAVSKKEKECENLSCRSGKRPAVIICPGGGYESVAMAIEGFQFMERIEQAGYKAFILNYRVTPNHFPEPQFDLALAAKYIRAHAGTYGIDPENVMFIGSSAGGHLCASTALYVEEIESLLMKELKDHFPKLAEQYQGIPVKPEKLCLNYPVISFQGEAHEPSFQALTGGEESLRNKLSVEQHIDSGYPKTFVWACEDDDLVPVSNAKRMAEALEAAGVDHQIRIYPTGGHGCGLAAGTSAENWMNEMLDWIS